MSIHDSDKPRPNAPSNQYIQTIIDHAADGAIFDEQNPQLEKHCTAQEIPEVLYALHQAIREKTVQIFYKNAISEYVGGTYPVFSFIFKHNGKYVTVHLPHADVINLIPGKMQPSAYYIDEKRMKEKFREYRQVTENDYYAYSEAMANVQLYTGMKN